MNKPVAARLNAVLCMLLSMISSSGNAQDYNQSTKFKNANAKWISGQNAGLDFSSGNAVPFIIENSDGTGGYIWEGAATASDPVTGNLLFYSSGLVCRNANGDIMPNGSGLLGNHLSTTQGTCIVPMIDSPGKYYLFSLNGLSDTWGTSIAQGNLFYSVVDRSLDDGRGAIDAGRKNILLWKNGIDGKDSLSEAMIAIPGTHCDIWLLLHKLYRPEFVAYHITAGGIVANPVTSVTGGVYGGPYFSPGGNLGGAYLVGGLAVSPDRRMVAMASISGTGIGQMNGLLLCHFDPATGIVSGAIELGPVKSQSSYTMAFSPDNRRLYSATSDDWPVTPATLVQYTVDVFDSAAIAATRTPVFTFPLALGRYCYLRQFEGKIYVNSSNQFANNDRLSIIHHPNATAAACNFELNAISLPAGTQWGLQLSNELVYPVRGEDTVYYPVQRSTICEGGRLMLSAPDNGIGYTWSDGGTGRENSISQPGNYRVVTALNCGNRVDSFQVEAKNMVIDLGPDTTLCTYNGQLVLNAGVYAGASYRWQDGSREPTLLVTQPGTYSLEMTVGDCQARDSIRVSADCNCIPFIPNAFSPNHDSRNDAFGIALNCPTEQYELDIYNRFGQHVFHGGSPGSAWDGTFEGRPCDVGTYFYRVSYSARFTGKEITKKGDVMLIR